MDLFKVGAKVVIEGSNGLYPCKIIQKGMHEGVRIYLVSFGRWTEDSLGWKLSPLHEECYVTPEVIKKHKGESCLWVSEKLLKESSMPKLPTKQDLQEALETIAQYCSVRDCNDCCLKEMCEKLEMKEFPFYYLSLIMNDQYGIL